MKSLNKIRYLVTTKINAFKYKLTKNEKFREKSEHYKKKYDVLNVISRKKFRKYIQKRAKLDIYDIDNLSAPFPCGVESDEIWTWNDYYGIADIYKKYAGYPLDYKLKFVVDHAIYYYNTRIHPEEYKVNMPAHICTSNYAKGIMAPHVTTELYPAGLHMFYVDDYYDESKFNKEKKKLGKNLLVFPCHSSDCFLVDYKPDKLIKEILKIKNEHDFDSVTVCFYFCEIQRGFHKNFEGYGFNFVTAGHILDPMFLSRLKTIIKLSDVTMSNDIGSHVFYSIGMDKPHYVIPERDFEYHGTWEGAENSPSEIATIEDLESSREDSANYMELFSKYTEQFTEEQKIVKEKICGLESFKTPEEIKEFFEKTEKLYQNGEYLKYNKHVHRFSMASYAKKNKKD